MDDRQIEDLFGGSDIETEKGEDLPVDAPLAVRMRPQTLQEYVGQDHILGKGKLLRRAIEADRLSSVIFYGPPGTGKTTLARIIAGCTKSRFIELSGVEGSVADIRKAVARAAIEARRGGRTLLFIDEIHRFNKAQQDALLPDVERGTVRLIGATTQNPYFSINSPLVSRSQIFQLQPLTVEDLLELQYRAVADETRGLGLLPVSLDEAAARHLATLSDGDARKCLNALEIAARTTPYDGKGMIRITLEIAAESIQKKALVYDGAGDDHYDTASAFIKSLRGSDPDAALYWLSKMLHAGEELRFITRRLVIFASEDVGLADPLALSLAMAAQQAVEFVGLPEARITLAHAVVYLAAAPKSNSAYAALGRAERDLGEGRTLAVPAALRSSNYSGAKALGHGEGYQYPHDYEGGYVPQAYLAEGRVYYIPTRHGAESRIADRLEAWRTEFENAKGTGGAGSTGNELRKLL
jgi:putative ATPase